MNPVFVRNNLVEDFATVYFEYFGLLVIDIFNDDRVVGGIYFYRVSRCLIDTRLRPIYRNRVGIWRFSFVEYGRDIVGINVSFFYFRVGIALGRRELFVQFAIAIQVISIEDKRFIGHIGCNKLYIVDEQADFTRRYTVDCDIFGIVRQFEAVLLILPFFKLSKL